ncbi:MAG: bifunctional ornithine acetyltransferase/N-acetylglutamate synthase [Nitrosomonadaceae bacterium]|nr:bifunctional ornithine acetyltransferase/N-acetylglutamate synthase [Nitrosomonadaceae bacterium]|tara:strand:- start:2701 stop:3963 length:1263 start_codon:yes stop_codon:yes gene_type:complete
MSANPSFDILGELLPIKGVSLGVAEAGIRQSNHKDLLLIALDENIRIEVVFTQNKFCAAPVIISKEHIIKRNKGGSPVASKIDFIRALIINTGSANAGTGEKGIKDTRLVCAELARLLKCDVSQILPFSTGVIMEPLPVEKIIQSLPIVVANLSPDNWYSAAETILTTDIVPKAVSKKILLGDSVITITGIAKGSGMIRPNMATMLSYLATDAAISQALLRKMINNVVDNSFNRITVDGDTSTNDSFVLIATGRADNQEILDDTSIEYIELQNAITEVAVHLAKGIVKDGEGATKFITIRVEGGKDMDECTRVAYAIAHSPLVKTAFFASDPNLGRIIAAIGNAEIQDLNVYDLQFYLDDLLVFENGRVSENYSEKDGSNVMNKPEITIRVLFKRGESSTTVWTCDLSYDYIKINSDYRS